jgi:hypothetical protein
MDNGTGLPALYTGRPVFSTFRNPPTARMLLMKLVQRFVVNKGTVFRYCTEFHYSSEDNGTSFL